MERKIQINKNIFKYRTCFSFCYYYYSIVCVSSASSNRRRRFVHKCDYISKPFQFFLNVHFKLMEYKDNTLSPSSQWPARAHTIIERQSSRRLWWHKMPSGATAMFRRCDVIHFFLFFQPLYVTAGELRSHSSTQKHALNELYCTVVLYGNNVFNCRFLFCFILFLFLFTCLLLYSMLLFFGCISQLGYVTAHTNCCNLY